MKIGHPFKARWTGRPPVGMLLTPDILKFKIPVPFAFVPPHPEKEGRALSHKGHQSTRQEKPKMLSSASVAVTKECQKTVQNFNNCVRNNSQDACGYYANYLRAHCQRK
jgi:hypothetical protein